MKAWLAMLSLCLATAPAAAQPERPRKPTAEAATAALIEGAKASRSDAMLVLRDGKTVAEYYRSGQAPGPIEMMSATKSIVALAIGGLIADGKIASLDAPVHTWYPEWKQGRKRQISLRMLMDHTSGLQNVMRADEEIYPSPDFVQLALAAELDSDPGKAFAYNNKAVNLLAGIVAKASGVPMDRYLQRKLFTSMGIQPGTWERDKAGNPHAMSGLPLRAADAAKLGQLVLDEGRWNGQQLLPAAFVREMLSASKLVGESGLLWWREPAWGRFIAEAGSLDTMRKAGVPEAVVSKLQPLVGRSFEGQGELIPAIEAALGEGAMETWGKEVMSRGLSPGKIFKIDMGPMVAYAAKGFQGQFIVIVPQARLVAVRLVASTDEWKPSDGYDDFGKRVIALADALVSGDLKPLP